MVRCCHRYQAPIISVSASSDIPGNTVITGMDTRAALQILTVPLCPYYPPGIRHHPLSTKKTPSELMSHSSSTAASSPNFQQVINDALKLYKRRTRNDLLNHPLASKLQVCDSPAAILTVLHQQVEGPDDSRSRRTKWLVPTVKVLYTLSATLEERAGLVSLRT
jgi:hypothetical protein